jgi:hypothetical protein
MQATMEEPKKKATSLSLERKKQAEIFTKEYDRIVKSGGFSDGGGSADNAHTKADAIVQVNAPKEFDALSGDKDLENAFRARNKARNDQRAFEEKLSEKYRDAPEITTNAVDAADVEGRSFIYPKGGGAKVVRLDKQDVDQTKTMQKAVDDTDAAVGKKLDAALDRIVGPKDQGELKAMRLMLRNTFERSMNIKLYKEELQAKEEPKKIGMDDVRVPTTVVTAALKGLGNTLG